MLYLKKKIAVGTVATMLLLLSLSLSFTPPVSAQTLSFSFPRPLKDHTYDQTYGNAAQDGKASVGLGLHVWKYKEQLWSDQDAMLIRLDVSANTRVGIRYKVQYSTGSGWRQVSTPTGITGDDSGKWINLPFPVIFYGVQYNRVWICSNGFLSFDSSRTDYSPQNIPNKATPNTLVAPFWRDLDPSKGGSITYGSLYESPFSVFVVSWNQVPNYGNGVPQTFQVLIYTPYDAMYHNGIYFVYQSITKDYPTTVGVENQIGDVGSSYDYTKLTSNSNLMIWYPDVGYRAQKLTLRISKTDSLAAIDIDETYVYGYNVVLKETRDIGTDTFMLAVKGCAFALISGYGGIICGTALIVSDTAIHLAQILSKPEFGIRDATTTDTLAYVAGYAYSEASNYIPYGYPFDCSLATQCYWKFFDRTNEKSHSITITAELEYSLGPYGATSKISTSIIMNVPKT